MANFNFNKVILGGRLTADPELKTTANGIVVTSFSIAVNRRPAKSTDGQASQQSDFFNCTAWRSTAEFISRYFRKGQNIGLNGSIQTRTYQDKDTGKNRTAFEVVINNAYFVENKKAEEPQNNPYLPPVQTPEAQLEDFSNISDETGDLPF